MAALRRVAALAVKINLGSTAKSRFFAGEKARRCVAAGLCVAAGGAAALYFYSGVTSGRARRRQSISGYLRSFSIVEAKEKVGKTIRFSIIITIILNRYVPYNNVAEILKRAKGERRQRLFS